MIQKFNVGDIVKIKKEYHNLKVAENGDAAGIVTAITKSCDHEYKAIRKLEEHAGRTFDIIKVMTSDGNISEWFDDEIDVMIQKTIDQE